MSLYSWAPGDWGQCSRSCGSGQQTRPLRCLRKVTYQREEVVAHSLCPIISPAQVQPCQTQTCPPEWSTGSWSQVSLCPRFALLGRTGKYLYIFSLQSKCVTLFIRYGCATHTYRHAEMEVSNENRHVAALFRSYGELLETEWRRFCNCHL